MIDLTRNRKPISDFIMLDLNEFMTTQEAAEKLGFHVKSVQNMVKNQMHAIRFGRAWLVSRKSVGEYLKKTEGMSRNDPRRKQKSQLISWLFYSYQSRRNLKWSRRRYLIPFLGRKR